MGYAAASAPGGACCGRSSAAPGWPLLAVLAYGLTVVDMALVIGPTSPPTLAVLAWQWLLDADPARNAQGAAAAWLLARRWWAAGGPRLVRPARAGCIGAGAGRDGHAAASLPPAAHAARLEPRGALLRWRRMALVLLALAVGSVSGVWRFPALWPHR
jgi:putative thiamine transport system permease protein